MLIYRSSPMPSHPRIGVRKRPLPLNALATRDAGIYPVIGNGGSVSATGTAEIVMEKEPWAGTPDTH
jgi:hypothetical protein